MSTLTTKTAPHLPWSLAAGSPADTIASITAAASPEALGVTPEAPNGVPVKGRTKGEAAAPKADGNGDAAMADAPADSKPDAERYPPVVDVVAAEAAAAEKAVDAAGDGRDGALG